MTSTTLRGIDLAPLLEIRGGNVELRACLGCQRPMQQDRRKVAGWEPLPGIARHESGGKCQACCQAGRRPRTAPRPRATRPDAVALAKLLTADLEWAGDAACAAAPRPNAFALPDNYRGEGPTHDAIVAARRYCTRCPVLDACRDYANAHDSSHTPMTGLWGAEWRTAAAVVPITTKATA